MQNRKFRLIDLNLVSNCSSRLNKENEYPHFMFLTINSEVIWSLKSPKSCVMSAIAVERFVSHYFAYIQLSALSGLLIWSGVNLHLFL